jgi:NAD(P)-dependent dehydrogenase (short-subunit alcohol dehydrogenase family)
MATRELFFVGTKGRSTIMSRLQGKAVLITGGGSGIGLASARALLAEGARVAISARDEATRRRAADSLKAGERVIYRSCDVTDAGQVAALIAHVTEAFGRVDILVNNAGMNVKERTLRELSPESWQKQVRANLDGAFFCIHAVLPQMLARKDGLIINVNSVAGLRASPLGGAAYSAAKFGLHALALCLAEEVREAGVRVSTIYPGEVDTPILENRPKPVTAEHRQRILQPEDIAEGVVFVATLPPRASVPELVMKPTSQAFV